MSMEFNILGEGEEGVLTDTSEISSIDICPSCGYNNTEPPGANCTFTAFHGLPLGCPITKEIIPE